MGENHSGWIFWIGKNLSCKAGDRGDAGSVPGLGRSLGGEQGNPLQYSCLGNPMDRGAWQATVHWVSKSGTWLSRLSTKTRINDNSWKSTYWGSKEIFGTVVHDFLQKLFKLQSDFSLRKAMATHSTTLAWEIPWTEKPGRLQSMGSLGVRHDWANSLSLFTLMHCRRKWQPTPVFLPGESQRRGSLVGCRLWGRAESDTTEAT